MYVGHCGIHCSAIACIAKWNSLQNAVDLALDQSEICEGHIAHGRAAGDVPFEQLEV